MSKIKVLHVIPSVGVGGAEKLALDICKFINKSKFEVKLVSLFASTGSVYEQFARENNIEIIFLDKELGFDYKIIKKLRNLFKREQVDIINTHLSVIIYILPAIILRKKIKVFHTVHNMANKELIEPIKLIMRVAYKFLGVTPIGISDYITKTIHTEYNIKLSKIPCIYNGIDSELFSYRQRTSNKITKFIHVGRFTEQKNHRLLIQAFNLAVKKNPNMTLSLVGGGELFEEIQEYVKELGLCDKIIFRGIQKNVKNELEEADIFVMTSNWEGLPISVLEAMACGLPIITTRAGGVVDIVKHRQNGLVVELEDEQGIAEAMLVLSKENKLVQEMSTASRELVNHYDIRKQVEKYEQLYEK